MAPAPVDRYCCRSPLGIRSNSQLTTRKPSAGRLGNLMIIFTVVFGESYIARFFERCLPSLLEPLNAPALDGEPLELRIYTLDRDMHILERYASAPVARFFNTIGTIHPVGGRLSHDTA